MQQSFSNILVPVDFTENTAVAVAKALDVIDKNGGTLHLLHVQKVYWRQHKTAANEAAISRLSVWKELLEESTPGLQVQCRLEWSTSIQKCITTTAGLLGVDLIVIGKKSQHKWPRFKDTANPSQLAAKTGIPVLTVRPGSMHQPIKTVVVPLSESLPEAKMKALEILCSRLRPMVHLVAFGRQAAITKAATNTLLHLYEWVQNTLQCPVEFTLLEGNCPAKQLMRYAAQTNADVLLVHPEGETKLDFWNRHIQDVLPAHSKVQVLAVHCAANLKQETHYE